MAGDNNKVVYKWRLGKAEPLFYTLPKRKGKKHYLTKYEADKKLCGNYRLVEV